MRQPCECKDSWTREKDREKRKNGSEVRKNEDKEESRVNKIK